MTEVERIQGMLKELFDNVSDLRSLLQPFDDQKKEIDTDIKSLRKEIQKKEDEKYEIERKVSDTRAKLRTLDFDIRKAERDLTLAERAEEIKLAAARLQKEFDDIIAGAPWREFAFDHQIEGAKRMATAKRGLLADKVGLGKSLTSLIWLDLIKSKRVVAIVPKDTASNYVREIRHWAPHRMVLDLTGKTKIKRDMVCDMLSADMDRQFIIVLNYEAWRRDNSLIDNLIKLKVDTVIIDEAHVIKNNSTNAAKGVTRFVLAENQCPAFDITGCSGSMQWSKDLSRRARVCDTCGEESVRAFDACSVKNVLCLTGTPILNKPQDLFPILRLIDPVVFSSEYTFLNYYCRRDPYTNRWGFSSGGLESITSKLSDRYLARDRKQAGIHIPPQEIQYHDIEFDPADYPKQAEVLRNLNHFARVVLDSDRAIGILAMIELILRKRQAVLFPGSIQFKDPITKEILYKVECDESMKLDRLINKDGEGLIPELTADGDLVEGERVVVFSQFKTALKELETRLAKYAPDISVCRYDGDTNERVQEEIKLDFDRKYTDPQKAKYQVMLANYKKGGQGLNFTGATQMILMDEEWNPGKEEQAMGRLDRMGQTEETTVHVLRMQNSIDTWMAELIEQKRDMIAGFDKGMQMQQELLRGIDEGML